MLCCCCGGGCGCGWTVSSPSSEEEEDDEDMEEEDEEQGGGELGGHWELWLGTADWELWGRRQAKGKNVITSFFFLTILIQRIFVNTQTKPREKENKK